MAGGIFVSYRRDDAKHAAGRLVDRLGRTFSSDQLFLDIDNIEPGLDFKRVLSEKVQACDVLLAVIGPGWIDSKDATCARRLDNPKDFVRIEIEAALQRDVRVIPILVDGARMPDEEELPDTLRPLAYRNAVRLVHERFASDAEDLIRALTKALSPTEVKQLAPVSVESANAAARKWNLGGLVFVLSCAGGFVLPVLLAFSGVIRLTEKSDYMALYYGSALLAFVAWRLVRVWSKRDFFKTIAAGMFFGTCALILTALTIG